jgi:hypothetical protein
VTFWFVAQCLNQLRHRVSYDEVVTKIFKFKLSVIVGAVSVFSVTFASEHSSYLVTEYGIWLLVHINAVVSNYVYGYV